MSQRPCGENDMQYQGSLGFLVKPRDPKSHLAMKLGLEFKYISNMVMGGASLASMPAPRDLNVPFLFFLGILSFLFM